MEQSKHITMEQSNRITMEQSNRASGTSMPHVLQFSSPVPVSILPQPCNPNYFEHDVSGVAPTPNHNTTSIKPELII